MVKVDFSIVYSARTCMGSGVQIGPGFRLESVGCRVRGGALRPKGSHEANQEHFRVLGFRA